MELKDNGKTYMWIGGKWGSYDISFCSIDLRIDIEGKKSVHFWGKSLSEHLCTFHTPEQLVKLGYMELIETKPEEEVESWGHFEIIDGIKVPAGTIQEAEETKPEEKPQFDDSQLLIGRNTYNPFNNEWKEIPECKHEQDGVGLYLSNPPKYKCKKCGEFYITIEEKIPEVEDYSIDRKDQWQPQLTQSLLSQTQAITTSLNLLIKAHNKKINNL